MKRDTARCKKKRKKERMPLPALLLVALLALAPVAHGDDSEQHCNRTITSAPARVALALASAPEIRAR